MTEPTFFEKMKDLGKSLAVAVGDRGRMTTKEQFLARIAVCDKCEHRDGAKCGLCGCTLSVKAQMKRWDCPLKKWPRTVESQDLRDQPTKEDENE